MGHQSYWTKAPKPGTVYWVLLASLEVGASLGKQVHAAFAPKEAEVKRLGQWGLSLAIAAMVATATPMAVFANDTTLSPAQSVASVTPGNIIVAGSLQALPVWVVKADRYVHVSKGVARIDAAASTGLDAATLAQTQQAVNLFNAQPSTARLNTPYPDAGIHVFGKPAPANLPGAVALAVQPMISCNLFSGTYASLQWWGVYFHMGECLTVDVELTGGGATAIIGLIAYIAVSDPLIAPFIVPIGLALVAGFAAIAWVDYNFCNNHGISVGVTWWGSPTLGC